MFCASLRKRPEWAAAVPVLLKKETRDWKETKLETHDIAMAMPGVGTIDSGGVFLRFILLSALDVERSGAMQRIERLFYLEGGRRCAVVFLLSTNGDEDGLSALGQLQVEIMEKSISIPILPLTSLDDLPARLESFRDKLLALKPSPSPILGLDAKALLQHCSPTGPLPEVHTRVLTGLNTSFSDLLDKLSTSQGQAIVQDYAPEVSDSVIRFWTTESRI